MRHAGDRLDTLGRIGRHAILERLEADRVRVDERFVGVPALDQQVVQSVKYGGIGANPQHQVNIGLLRRRRPSWIDDDHLRWVRAAAAVENAHPQHRIGVRHVVADMEKTVRDIDIVVTAGLSVTAEGLLQSGGRSGRAKTRVTVHMRRPQPRFADESQRVVLLEEELAGRVEADR